MRMKARFQEWMISLLERRYSGIREVVGLLDKIRERVENQEIAGLQDFPEENVKDEKEAKADENGVEKSSKEENGELKADGDVEKKEETDGDSIFKPDDGKWRPILATLALYKLQKVSVLSEGRERDQPPYQPDRLTGLLCQDGTLLRLRRISGSRVRLMHNLGPFLRTK